MPSFFIPRKVVTDGSLKVDIKLLRAVLAAAFNRDLDEDEMLSEAEAVAALGAMILRDLGFDSMDILEIFRHFKDVIEDWSEKLRAAVASHGGFKPLKSRPGPLMLAISDNERATLMYDSSSRTKYYDFKRAKELTTPVGVAPILQLGLNLSQLFESVVDTRQSGWYSQTVKEALQSVKQEGQSVD